MLIKSNHLILTVIFFSLFIVKVIGQENHLIVIDSNFAEKNLVISKLSNEKKIILTSDVNPWKKIREQLETNSSITKIHLFVEANYNSFLMGGISYNLEIIKNELELTMLEGLYQGSHYQLLFYNCNLGSNDEGIELLKSIGDLTYMNVGTSSNCSSIFDSSFTFNFQTLNIPLTQSILNN